MLQITEKGITIDSFDDIYSRLADRFRDIYGENINLDPSTPDGQLLGIFVQELSTIHQLAAFAMQMQDPYLAQGRWLEMRAMYAGIKRITAEYSYIDEVIITGKPKTVIKADSILTDPQGVNWVTLATVTLNELGSTRVKVRSEQLGDFKVKKMDVFSSKMVIIGIEGITANGDSYGGMDEETDAQLLRRFMRSHAINNLDDRAGLEAKISNLSGVNKCVVYENFTGKTDTKGIPAHSLNAVILGGDDKEIAEVITKNKIGGCGLYGKVKTSYPLNGINRVVHYDRPTQIDIAVSITIGRYSDFDDIDTDHIISNLKALDFNIGENVYSSRIISSINLVDGFYIKAITLNDGVNVDIDSRAYAKITACEVLIEG